MNMIFICKQRLNWLIGSSHFQNIYVWIRVDIFAERHNLPLVRPHDVHPGVEVDLPHLDAGVEIPHLERWAVAGDDHLPHLAAHQLDWTVRSEVASTARLPDLTRLIRDLYNQFKHCCPPSPSHPPCPHPPGPPQPTCRRMLRFPCGTSEWRRGIGSLWRESS